MAQNGVASGLNIRSPFSFRARPARPGRPGTSSGCRECLSELRRTSFGVMALGPHTRRHDPNIEFNVDLLIHNPPPFVYLISFSPFFLVVSRDDCSGRMTPKLRQMAGPVRRSQGPDPCFYGDLVQFRIPMLKTPHRSRGDTWKNTAAPLKSALQFKPSPRLPCTSVLLGGDRKIIAGREMQLHHQYPPAVHQHPLAPAVLFHGRYACTRQHSVLFGPLQNRPSPTQQGPIHPNLNTKARTWSHGVKARMASSVFIELPILAPHSSFHWLEQQIQEAGNINTPLQQKGIDHYGLYRQQAVLRYWEI